MAHTVCGKIFYYNCIHDNDIIIIAIVQDSMLSHVSLQSLRIKKDSTD